MSSQYQVAGLASGFDWKSFIDQTMELERVPAARLENEQALNSQRASLIGGITSRLKTLRSAGDALAAPGVFEKRTTSVSASGAAWSVSAAVGAPTGLYKIAVSQLATSASLAGTGGIARGIAPDGDVSAVTLANMSSAPAVSAGTFTLNGQKITVALTDSLQDVFDQIAARTGGDVSASYDAATDRVTMVSASGPLLPGAASDTSNFLSAVKLAYTGGSSVMSSGAVGAVKQNALLSDTNLVAPITAVDADGKGSFSINGVSIDYSTTTDTLASVMTRISASAAGVNAVYDATAGRMVLTNKQTGNYAIAVSEPSADGGFLQAVGLLSGANFSAGRNAEFSLNGGATLTSASNTLAAASHGITGLQVTVAGEETQTITVSADTTAMKKKVEDFITAFNDFQQYVDTQTKVTSEKGKVTAAALANNREVQEWGRSIRSIAFSAVSGLGGEVKRITDLGLDFKPGTNALEIEDEEKLTAALSSPTAELSDFFGKAGAGLSEKLDAFIDKAANLGADQQKRLNDANKAIDEQIAAIERRLEQQRALLESAFMQMEQAQATIKQQQSAIDNAFPKK